LYLRVHPCLRLGDRKRMSQSFSEEILVDHAERYLQFLGWKTRRELVTPRALPDMVAIKDDQIWILEGKRTLSLDLLSQLFSWQGFAHRISGIVPQVHSNWHQKRGRSFARSLLREKGIGCFTVDIGGTPPSIYELIEPRVDPRPVQKGFILRHLENEYKRPGQIDLENTEELLLEYVTQHPGVTLREALRDVSHHYSSFKSACSNLLKRLEQGKIAGLRGQKNEHGIWQLYPILM